MGGLRVYVASAVVAVHRHPSEERPEDVVELLELIVLLVVLLAVLRTGPLLLRTESIVVRPLLRIDQHRVGVGDLLEDLLGACVSREVPSYWFLSGWKRRARLR